MSAFDEARAAGMSPERSGRWAAYVAMKAERGEEPITLAEALAQPVERRQELPPVLARVNTMLDRVRLIYAAHVFTAYGAVVGDDRPVEEVAQ